MDKDWSFPPEPVLKPPQKSIWNLEPIGWLLIFFSIFLGLILLWIICNLVECIIYQTNRRKRKLSDLEPIPMNEYSDDD